MAIPGMAIGVPTIMAVLLAIAAQQPKGPTDAKHMKPVDLAKCNLKAVEIESVDHVQLDAKTKLVPSRKDARLILIHIKGVSPEIGPLPCYAPSFGVHYPGEETMAFSAAKAVGLRGKSADGKPFEAWFNVTENTTNILIQSPGDEVSFWLAVEVPRDVKEVLVRIPTYIPDPVQIPSR